MFCDEGLCLSASFLRFPDLEALGFEDFQGLRLEGSVREVSQTGID